MRLPAILLLFAAWLPARADSGLKLTPERVEMGTFYSGAQLRVEGTARPDSKVVLVVKGANVTEVFNKKGRVGPIWINSGKVHISGVPSLFLSFSAEPVHQFLSREHISRHQLDFEAIKAQMRVEPRQESLDLIRTHYLTLKTEEGRYKVATGAIKYGALNADGVPFSADIEWSKKISPGIYEIRAYECLGGAVLREMSVPLEVVEIGFPAFMSALSKNHPTLYGMLAVLVAVIAGFGIDFLASRLTGRKSRAKEKPLPETAPAPIEETHARAKDAKSTA